MSENRELSMDDYLAMLRRRLKVILIPAAACPAGGFHGLLHAFPPKYTSQSTVLVEGQKVPDSYVAPVITSDFTQRVQTLSQEVLSPEPPASRDPEPRLWSSPRKRTSSSRKSSRTCRSSP